MAFLSFFLSVLFFFSFFSFLFEGTGSFGFDLLERNERKLCDVENGNDCCEIFLVALVKWCPGS